MNYFQFRGGRSSLDPTPILRIHNTETLPLTPTQKPDNQRSLRGVHWRQCGTREGGSGDTRPLKSRTEVKGHPDGKGESVETEGLSSVPKTRREPGRRILESVGHCNVRDQDETRTRPRRVTWSRRTLFGSLVPDPDETTPCGGPGVVPTKTVTG